MKAVEVRKTQVSITKVVSETEEQADRRIVHDRFEQAYRELRQHQPTGELHITLRINLKEE